MQIFISKLVDIMCTQKFWMRLDRHWLYVFIPGLLKKSHHGVLQTIITLPRFLGISRLG